MQKKALRLLLIFVLTLCLTPAFGMTAMAEELVHTHCVCGNTTDSCDTGHSPTQTWTAWESNDSMPDTAGYYYLTKDVTISSTWEPADGTYLCLCGHILKFYNGTSSNTGVIKVNTGVHFTLTDCRDTVHCYKVGSDGRWTYTTENATVNYEDLTARPATNAVVAVKGGAVTGTGDYNTCIIVAGSLTVNNGNIIGGRGTNGGGVCLNSGASFTMNNGIICGNYAINTSGAGAGVLVMANASFTLNNGDISFNRVDYYGAGINNKGTLSINGGRIAFNYAGSDGGGLYLASGSTTTIIDCAITNNITNSGTGGGVYYHASGTKFTIGGTIKITDNTKTNGTASNLYLNKVTGKYKYLNQIYLGSKTASSEGNGVPILTAGAEIGVAATTGSTVNDPTPVTNASTKNVADFTGYFKSDDSNRSIQNAGSYNENLVKLISNVHIHCDCFNGSTQNHNSTHATTKTWTGTSTLPDTAGCWYLTANVTIDSTWEPVDGTYLCLNGKVIQMTGSGSAINVKEGVNFTLTDCRSTNTSFTNYFTVGENGLWVWNNSNTANAKRFNTLTARPEQGDVIAVTGGCITGGNAGSGGGISVSGTFTMNGGNIVGNQASVNGGAVNISAGTFTLKSGNLLGNCALGNGVGGTGLGGAVLVSQYNDSTFIMEGGTLAFNYANRFGGAACCYGDFKMSGGTISYNTVTNAGNNGGHGGGLDICNSSQSEITGGTITNNTAVGNGGGVYYEDNTSLKLGGTVKITGNTKSDGTTATNLYIKGNKTVAISTETPLTTGAAIGISTSGTPQKGTPVKVTGNNNDDYSSYFTSDNATYKIYNTGADALQLVKLSVHEHTWNYGVDADTLKAWCSEAFGADENCDNYTEAKAQTLKIQAPASLVYDGTGKAATLSTTTLGEFTLSASDIQYQLKTGESTYGTATTEAPKNVGTYKASITMGSGSNAKTASVEYTITQLQLTVSGTTAANKTYDGNTDTSVTPGTLDNIIGSEDVSIDTATATFNNKNVGENKDVTVVYTIKGDDAGNYTAPENGTVKANITARQLTISAPTAANKTYDGNTDTSVTPGTLDNIIGSDDVAIDTVTGTFKDKNVGTNKDVTVEYTIKGNDAGNYTAPEKGTVKANITVRQLTISGTTAANKTYDGNTTAAITAGTFDNAVSGDSVAIDTATGTFNDKNAGTNKDVTVVYTIKGDDAKNYTAPENGTVKASISPKQLTISAPTAANKTYDGNTEATVTAGTLNGIIGSDDVAIDTVTGTFADKDYGTSKAVTIIYTIKGNDAGNYDAPVNSTTSANITKRTVTLTSADDNKKYDGTALTNHNVTVGEDGFVDGEGAAYDFTGSQIAVGSSENAFTYTLNDNTKAGNYTISTTCGTLTVSQNDTVITITADSSNKKYDGNPLTDSGYTYTGNLASGDSFDTVTVTGSVTDAGEAANKVTAYKIVDSKGDDVTSFYSAIQTTNGKLTVTKRTVTLTSADDSKKYDGTALTNHNVTVGEDGFVDGEGAAYDFTGSQIAVGSSENAFTYTLNDNTKAGNYTISTTCGTLTVNQNDTVITITADSSNKKYDGNPLTDSGYTYTGNLASGDSFDTVTVTGSITNVGTTANKVTAYTIVNNNGDDVTSFYSAIQTANGTLTVNQNDTVITITADSSNKKYDGNPLTDSGYTYTGNLASGDSFDTVTVTGSITDAGEAVNKVTTYKIVNGNGDDVTSFYSAIQMADGKLTVTKRTVTLTSADDNKKYDGTALTNHNVTVGEDGFVDGESAAYDFTGSRTDVGSSKNTFTYTLNDGTKAENYSISTEDGTLTVTKRIVTLTSATAEKKYDTTELTNHNVTVGGDGFVDGEGAGYTFTGSQTDVGSSENTFSYILNAGTSAGNYDISTIYGTLTVTALPYDNNGSEMKEISPETKAIIDNKVNQASKEANQGLQEISEFNGNGNTQPESTSVSRVLGDNGYVKVFLKKVSFDTATENVTETSKIVTYTFEVIPYDSTGTELHSLPAGITFRLPLINPDGAPYAMVYHGDKFLKQVSLNSTDKYIEITQWEFSEYSYVLIDTDQTQNFFTDVTSDDYFYAAVLWGAENNIVRGVGNSLFDPNGITTRGQMVTFLWRAAGCPEPTVTECLFTDVENGSYYEKAILWAIENGITKGTSETTFSPEATVTRCQAVTFLARFAGVDDKAKGYTHPFFDVTIDDYYYNAVSWAAQNGITTGVGNHNFNPNDQCKRCDTVTFLWRYFKDR